MNKVKLTALMAAAAMVAMPSVASADVIDISQEAGRVTFFGFTIVQPATYDVNGIALGDEEDATPTVATEFTLSGTVNQDCSFYAGNDDAARDIDFGTIGVRTADENNVGRAFDMRAPATVFISTSTAGCNTANTVTITKENGLDGLRNDNPGGYDSNEFTANLPYFVAATYRGSNTTAAAPGFQRVLLVGTNEAEDDQTNGAWRSAFDMNVTIPRPQRALVAGDYSDKLTVTLAAGL